MSLALFKVASNASFQFFAWSPFGPCLDPVWMVGDGEGGWGVWGVVGRVVWSLFGSWMVEGGEKGDPCNNLPREARGETCWCKLHVDTNNSSNKQQQNSENQKKNNNLAIMHCIVQVLWSIQNVQIEKCNKKEDVTIFLVRSADCPGRTNSVLKLHCIIHSVLKLHCWSNWWTGLISKIG